MREEIAEMAVVDVWTINSQRALLIAVARNDVFILVCPSTLVQNTSWYQIEGLNSASNGVWIFILVLFHEFFMGNIWFSTRFFLKKIRKNCKGIKNSMWHKRMFCPNVYSSVVTNKSGHLPHFFLQLAHLADEKL